MFYKKVQYKSRVKAVSLTSLYALMHAFTVCLTKIVFGLD